MRKKTIPFNFTTGSVVEFKNNSGENPLMQLLQANYSDDDRNFVQISANILIIGKNLYKSK
ncbi:hypothetical protein [Elizabethkingia bruuniana]|uniref:Uncharacterized protein n=1 Tax=Elizabethkingia bruuniana TaxID=1756149 RepID=A0A7T7V058_9FLAO|nr:hypothetical protein [Elizabethkingia bruuniana]AQX85736.1 hypothetical protein AYC65_12290 [Elizabethkingia bruuniana]KUY22837.1 hypothetical protein ATB97_11635 [Elizabethkingia bruuniana]OPB68718.1 hypothetical protein BAY12_00795 [Elizabethkingia bruuniana]QDZ61912.1 hypothetical protein EVD20_01905 [Elizabethkingia bruuniana]QQN59406.1 hypothetical protein I6H88_02140 [Elizabethkingia bruuniana]